MQKKVQIVSDGSLDLSQEITKEHDIEVVPFYVSFDSETYQKEMVELGVRDFYNEMVEHPDVFPKSSMPSVDDFYQVFKKSAKEQIPVICICITRKFSGSLQSATVAKEMIEEEYPDAKITLIDSTVNTVLQGLFVLEACRLRDMGLGYEEIVEKILPIWWTNRETGRDSCRRTGDKTDDYIKRRGNLQFRTGKKPYQIYEKGCRYDEKLSGRD